MWWARSKPVDLYLSGGQAVLRLSQAVQGQAGFQALKSLALGPAAPWSQALLPWLTGAVPRGTRWRIWLGGRLSRLQTEAPIAGVSSIEQAEAALDAANASLCPGWQHRLSWWPQPGPQWLVASLPAELLGLEALLTEYGHSLQSLRPWWSGLGLSSKADWAVMDDEAITCCRWQSGVPTQAASWPLPADAAQQQAVLQRLASGRPLSCWRLSLEEPRRLGFAARRVVSDVE